MPVPSQDLDFHRRMLLSFFYSMVWDEWWLLMLIELLTITVCTFLGQKKYMCVYCHTAKPEIVVPESDSGISFTKFPVNHHLFWSFLWRVTQFFYLLCSQFRQKASGWINKTLLLIKQQKWLSEFCVKMIGSLAKIMVGQVTVNTHFFWPYHDKKLSGSQCCCNTTIIICLCIVQEPQVCH